MGFMWRAILFGFVLLLYLISEGACSQVVEYSDETALKAAEAHKASTTTVSISTVKPSSTTRTRKLRKRTRRRKRIRLSSSSVAPTYSQSTASPVAPHEEKIKRRQRRLKKRRRGSSKVRNSANDSRSAIQTRNLFQPITPKESSPKISGTPSAFAPRKETTTRCSKNNGGCAHTCRPTGSRKCGCLKGFSLSGDGHNCLEGACSQVVEYSDETALKAAEAHKASTTTVSISTVKPSSTTRTRKLRKRTRRRKRIRLSSSSVAPTYSQSTASPVAPHEEKIKRRQRRLKKRRRGSSKVRNSANDSRSAIQTRNLFQPITPKESSPKISGTPSAFAPRKETTTRCSKNNGGCAHTCRPTGSRKCGCLKGFSLSGDGHNCLDQLEEFEEELNHIKAINLLITLCWYWCLIDNIISSKD
ncbi:hypothetical protein HUJ05_003839 [Dendroctonus ponderosae]|nr:hypothetical protein HUJ05_003839 [Dendroctonus ponderosae]